MSGGFVSLVGAGPGDPGLLTLAGRDRLSQADVIIYDRLVNPEILKHARDGAELIFAGKAAGRPSMSQDAINDLLVEKARAGNRVVRLKGGDPFVFGRGGEEALALVAAGIAFDVVPGVTSAIAAPAYAGVPVSHRGIASSFAVVTGHEDDAKEEQSVDWARLAVAVDTLVVLMGGAALESISRRLIEAGRKSETPAVSIEWGTTTQQRSVAAPLSGIFAAVREAGLGTPLLTVIGEVGRLRSELAWFEKKPLFGKRVLVTRTREQASGLSQHLRDLGAMPVELPTLELAPVARAGESDAAVAALAAGAYAWCVFTSVNAVRHFWDRLVAVGLDARAFSGCRLAVIGKATGRALEERGLRPDLSARGSTSEGLLDALLTEVARGTRVLIPRAGDARDVLPNGLREAGALVDEVVLYEARVPTSPDREVLAQLREGRIDAVTFASSSSVRNLAMLLGDHFDRLKDVTVACIGPVTADTAREYGLTVAVEPLETGVAALAEALAAYYAEPSGR